MIHNGIVRGRITRLRLGQTGNCPPGTFQNGTNCVSADAWVPTCPSGSAPVNPTTGAPSSSDDFMNAVIANAPAPATIGAGNGYYTCIPMAQYYAASVFNQPNPPSAPTATVPTPAATAAVAMPAAPVAVPVPVAQTVPLQVTIPPPPAVSLTSPSTWPWYYWAIAAGAGYLLAK